MRVHEQAQNLDLAPHCAAARQTSDSVSKQSLSQGMPSKLCICSYAGDTTGSLRPAAHMLEMLEVFSGITATMGQEPGEAHTQRLKKLGFKPYETRRNGRKVLPLPTGMLLAHARAAAAVFTLQVPHETESKTALQPVPGPEASHAR